MGPSSITGVLAFTTFYGLLVLYERNSSCITFFLFLIYSVPYDSSLQAVVVIRQGIKQKSSC
jgi:hypothetical protein